MRNTSLSECTEASENKHYVSAKSETREMVLEARLKEGGGLKVERFRLMTTAAKHQM